MDRKSVLTYFILFLIRSKNHLLMFIVEYADPALFHTYHNEEKLSILLLQNVCI